MVTDAISTTVGAVSETFARLVPLPSRWTSRREDTPRTLRKRHTKNHRVMTAGRIAVVDEEVGSAGELIPRAIFSRKARLSNQAKNVVSSRNIGAYLERLRYTTWGRF
jgi:hypothetical protein